MAKHSMEYSRHTLLAAEVLGHQVAQGRRARGWTATELAERIGVHPGTVTRIEAGTPSVALGTVLEAAVLCGVPLFGLDEGPLAAAAVRGRELMTLLPARVRPREEPVRDDF